MSIERILKSDELNKIGISKKIMGFTNGEKVMVKSTEGQPQEALAEYFAYRLGERLGLGVNRVEIINFGDKLDDKLDPICTVHWWEEDFIVYRNFEDIESDFEVSTRKFFDLLLENDDRHGSNYGFLNDEIFFIDHGCCSPWEVFSSVDKPWLKKHAREIPEIAKKFMSITEQEFEELATVDRDIYNYGSRTKYIVRRMLEAQSILKEEN